LIQGEVPSLDGFSRTRAALAERAGAGHTPGDLRNPSMDTAGGWPEAIHRALGELGVRQVAYVPDAGHARLIELCQADPAMRAVVLTTEEEGVALAAGAWLGGQRAVLLMQSSGIGNCVNMLALNRVCRLPLLALLTMRGEWGEQNPWQLPMGQNAADVLKAAGVIVQRLDEPQSAAQTVLAAGAMAFEGQVAVAVLIGQRLIGAKSFAR
jgi:sulfopyruvate decarboxylase alpha subunit